MKPEIVLIHGYRGNPSGLAEIAEELAKSGYRVYNPSIPPFGDAAPLKNYTKEEYADFVADFIKKQGIERPVLVGHSMGSLIAAAVAEKYPELIHDKLILLAPISVKPAKPIAVISPLAVKVPRHTVDLLTTSYLITPQSLKTTQKILRLTHSASKQYTTKEDVIRAGRFSSSYAISSFNFQKNTLLLAGAHDHLIPKKRTLKLAEQLSERMPARAVFLKKTGHLLNYEKPRETAEEIVKFLEDAPNPEMPTPKVFGAGVGYQKLSIIFLIGSLAGYLYEVIFNFVVHLAENGEFFFERRSGVIYGPFSIVYGAGAVLMAKALAEKNFKWWQTFLLGGVICGAAEYLVGWLQEIFTGTKSWDYSDQFLNLNGRTSLQIVLIWGFASAVFIHLFYPLVDKLCRKIPYKIGSRILNVVMILLCLDMLLSFSAVVRMNLRHTGSAPATPYGKFLDTVYPDERMREAYPNTYFVEDFPEL